jgi:hypothetical protein
LAPNPDALYFMIFFNTKDVGPVVIDVPPADGVSFAANIDTVWQMPLEDAGPYGADKGSGGKYLILPPGKKNKTPDGYISVQSETFAGYGLFRVNLASHADADIAKAEAYGRRLKVYSLSQAAIPPDTKFTDAKDVIYDSTISFDMQFFESLDRIVQTEPWQTRDKAMIDQLKTIGIEKGKTFSPDVKMIAVLNAAAGEAREYLERMYDAGFPTFFPTSRWAEWTSVFKIGSLSQHARGRHAGQDHFQRRLCDHRWPCAGVARRSDSLPKIIRFEPPSSFDSPRRPGRLAMAARRSRWPSQSKVEASRGDSPKCRFLFISF